jgi:multidrug efflux system outer membrane protein
MPRRIFAALFLLAAALAWAQDVPRRLTLEEACALALENDTALKKSAIDLNLEKIKASSLWAELFPAISVSGGISYKIPLTDAAERGPTYKAEAGLKLGLSAGLPYLFKSAKLAYSLGLLNAESAKRLIALETAKSFYALVAESENLAALSDAETVAREGAARDEAAYKSGYRGELDYMQSRLGAESAALATEKARAAYRKNLDAFCAALGIENAAGIELSGTIEIAKMVVDADALTAEHLSRRPDIASLRGAAEKLELDAKQKKIDAKAPSLSLSATWGAEADKNFAWKNHDQVTAGATLSIPVNPWIPRTKEHQALAADDAATEKARLDLAEAEKNARREIRSLASDLETGWTAVELAQLQHDIAARSYELSEAAYRRGAVNFLDFETARGKLAAAKAQLLESRLAYKLAVLSLASCLNIDESELVSSNKIN